MTVAAICVCTHRRPIGLSRFLTRLAEIQPDPYLQVDGGRIEVTVVVVDNEADGPRRRLVEEFAGKWPGSVTYAVEPRPGIAQARNRAVSMALPGADFVIFVDDDEVPEPGWVEELLRAQRRSAADVVVGPVVALFEKPPPHWIISGGFFERRRYADGQQIHYAWTGNVLISTEVFAVADPPFNEKFALNGGEDTFFFQQVNRAGFRIVCSERAVVSEYIPDTRCRLGWLLRREYRRGNTLSLCLIELEPSMWRRLKRVAHAAVAASEGVLLLMLIPLCGRRAAVNGSQRICFAAGLLAGLLGIVYEEYKQTHGH